MTKKNSKSLFTLKRTENKSSRAHNKKKKLGGVGGGGGGGGAFLLISRLSTSHWNLRQVLVIIHLISFSPLVSAHIPHCRLGFTTPDPLPLPLPLPREEVGHSHLRPRPVDHLELKRL